MEGTAPPLSKSKPIAIESNLKSSSSSSSSNHSGSKGSASSSAPAEIQIDRILRESGEGRASGRRSKRPSGGKLEDRESRESKEISSIMGGGLGMGVGVGDGDDDEEVLMINK
jgi:hypothetical protein